MSRPPGVPKSGNVTTLVAERHGDNFSSPNRRADRRLSKSKTTSGSPKRIINHGDGSAPPIAGRQRRNLTAPTTSDDDRIDNNPHLRAPERDYDTTRQPPHGSIPSLRRSESTRPQFKVSSVAATGVNPRTGFEGLQEPGRGLSSLAFVSQNLGIPFATLKTAMTGIRPIRATADRKPAGGDDWQDDHRHGN